MSTGLQFVTQDHEETELGCFETSRSVLYFSDDAFKADVADRTPQLSCTVRLFLSTPSVICIGVGLTDLSYWPLPVASRATPSRLFLDL